MRLKNCVVCGGVSLFAFSLVAPALREAKTRDETERKKAVLTAVSREPFDLPHLDPTIRTPDILPSVAAPSATGNTVDQSHWVDAYIAPRIL